MAIRSRNKGMTLIEFLVAITLSIFVLGVVFSIFWQSYKINQRNYIINDLTLRTKTTLDNIKSETNKSSAVISNHLSYSSGPQTLVLKTQRMNNNQSPIPGTYDYIIFKYDSSNGSIEKIHYIDAESTTRIIGKDITSFNLTYKDSNNITLNNDWPGVSQINTSLTLTNTIGGNHAMSLSSTAHLRNH